LATDLPVVTRQRFGLGQAVFSGAVLERSDHAIAKRSFQWLVSELLPFGPSFFLETYEHVWLTVFHQPERHRFVIHLLNYPANLPAVPVRQLRLRIRNRDDMVWRDLKRAPDQLELQLVKDGFTHTCACLDELADYAMLVLAYENV
jgi:hypothetical protein